MKRLKLVYIFRQLYLPTKFSQEYKPILTQLPGLTFFFISSSLRQNFRSDQINQRIMSDHKIALIVIEINRVNRGSGYWKINNSILLDTKYIQLI